MKARYTDMTKREKADYLAKHPDCALCGHIANGVDHSHESGLVRGSLCTRCNASIRPIEEALRIPTDLYSHFANELHRAILSGRTGVVTHLRDVRDKVIYLGMTPEEYEDRLRVVTALHTRRYVSWAPVDVPPADRVWSKQGPFTALEQEARLEELMVPGPPHLDIVLTLEPDDDTDVPAPRGITLQAQRTPGALDHLNRKQAAHDARPGHSPQYVAKCEAYVRLVHPVLLSRPLAAQQVRAAEVFPLSEIPSTREDLVDLFGDGYSPRWVDVAVRIALEDLGDDLPHASWATFTRARWHWQELLTHWLNRQDR